VQPPRRYSREQYNREQYSREQYNREQYNREQYNREQYNWEQYNREQYNREQYNREQYIRATLRGSEPWLMQGKDLLIMALLVLCAHEISRALLVVELLGLSLHVADPIRPPDNIKVSNVQHSEDHGSFNRGTHIHA
jgi:hypothetical protein